MNLLNLKRLHFHGATVQGLEGVRSGRNHLEIILANKRSTGFGRPPVLTDVDRFTAATAGLNDPERMEFDDDAPSLLAIRALMPLAKVAKVIADVDNDRRLSDAGRREKVQAAGVDAVKLISMQAAALRREHDAVRVLEVALFDAPLQMRSDDHVAIAHDREIRDRLLREGGQIDLALLGTILGGNGERIAAALMRSPLPLNGEIAARVQDAWRAAIAKREPQKAAAWKLAADGAEWAGHVVGNAARLTVEYADLSPVEVYKAAQPGGGVEAFGITPHQQAAFAHQIAQAA